MEYTTNLNLKKPDVNEYYNIEQNNENMDLIDEAVGELNKNKIQVATNDATITFTIKDRDESNVLWFQYNNISKELYVSVKNNGNWTDNLKLGTF